MMKIKVFNEKDIQNFKTDKKHIVISVQDPNYELVDLPEQESRLDYLGLLFYDLDSDTEVFPYSRYLFTNYHAKDILNFINKWKDKIDLICVNCVAGISRSAGIAGALSKILNNDDSYFFKHYCPNMLVYKTILKAYFGEEFKSFNNKPKNNNPNIQFL